MRETLTYTTEINGEQVAVTRHPPSDGKGLNTSTAAFGKQKKKPTKPQPVDEQLHALEALLEQAEIHDGPEVVQTVKAAIKRRLKELTRG